MKRDTDHLSRKVFFLLGYAMLLRDLRLYREQNRHSKRAWMGELTVECDVTCKNIIRNSVVCIYG